MANNVIGGLPESCTLAALLGVCACLLAGRLEGRQGVVETRDGHVYEGHIRFDSNLLVIVNAEKDLLTQVNLTNLQELTFPGKELDPPAPFASEPGWPFPWQAEDVGSVLWVAGNTTYENGTFKLNGSGTNIFGQSDSLHFVYKQVKGDSEIVARILQVQPSTPWAKAGLMMRQNLAADAANVFLAASPAGRGAFQWRTGRSETTTVELQPGIAPPCWLRLRREGNTVTASASRDALHWKHSGRITLPMMEEIYVGVAATGMKDAPANRGLFQFQRASIDNLREAPFLPNESITPAVELHSGSVVLGKIRRADEHTIHFGGTLPPGPISVGKVSRILFRWVPYGLRTRIQSGRSGVLLMNGAFIEGDFKGIDRGRVNISSVLLGLRSFDANNDVMAIVLRRSPLPSSLYEVKTLNGSTWLGPGLRIENGQVVLQEPALGPYPIPLYDILELRRKGGV